MTFASIRDAEMRFYPWAIIHDRNAIAEEVIRKQAAKIAKLEKQLQAKQPVKPSTVLAPPIGKKRPAPANNGNLLKMLRGRDTD